MLLFKNRLGDVGPYEGGIVLALVYPSSGCDSGPHGNNGLYPRPKGPRAIALGTLEVQVDSRELEHRKGMIHADVCVPRFLGFAVGG